MNSEAPTHIPAEPKEVFNAALAGVAAAFQSGDASLLLGADDMLQQLQEAQVCARATHACRSLPLSCVPTRSSVHHATHPVALTGDKTFALCCEVGPDRLCGRSTSSRASGTMCGADIQKNVPLIVCVGRWGARRSRT
jgi:hypothetical protein